ncbi:methyltransferase domain-containing protein [Geodermatophilus sp. SYSU D00684]
MGGCCDPRGCERVFDDRFARRMAARYRAKGLDRTARRMVDLLTERGVHGATVLEIGGGVGEIGLELLRRGAASVTALELSPGYEDQAAALAEEAGLTGRVHRRLADVAADPAGVEPADVVVLHRVVCCYPDHRRLLGAAADHARRDLVFSFPPRNPATRALLVTENASFRLRGRRFRTFAHPPAAMLAVLAEHGLRPAVVHRGVVWRVAHAAR